MVEIVEGVWDLSEPVRNAPCYCLLQRETVLEEKREQKRRRRRREENRREEKKKLKRDGTDLRGEAVRRERV